eukprot:1157822-Pelagomonas_calceolata.AAC.5
MEVSPHIRQYYWKPQAVGLAMCAGLDREVRRPGATTAAPARAGPGAGVAADTQGSYSRRMRGRSSSRDWGERGH